MDVASELMKGMVGGFGIVLIIIATFLPIFLLILAWRFTKAHERIAHSLSSFEQAHREAAVALRKLADIQSNKENKQP